MTRCATLAAGFAVLLLGAAGCSALGGSGSASPSASGKLASPTSTAIATPAGFPADVPVYPGARLTAGAAFSSPGQTAWGMTWQTADTEDKVQAFYLGKLKQGDWTVSFSGSAGATFSAAFARKSNSKVNGLIQAASSLGVTTISMSLVTPA